MGRSILCVVYYAVGQSCHFVRIRWVGGRWGSEGRGGGRSGEGGRSV